MNTLGKRYSYDKQQYAEYGIDTDKVLEKLASIPVSLHCWQIDDLTGFVDFDAKLDGGIAATGNALGKPRSKEEFFENLSRALKMIPGKKKIAIHAIYPTNIETFDDRDSIKPEHYVEWVDYAKQMGVGLDFNPTYFSHKKMSDNFTLASSDEKIRKFWIEHGKKSRKVGEMFGRELKQTCITNHWIPDGYKDYTIDKLAPRQRLKDSLDQIFSEPIDKKYNIDSVESKLFGLGIESYTVGSHEFYSNYAAINNNCIVCMDMGHFHPTETVSSKLSSYLAFGKEIMLHISRPVRWDSDHVVIMDDELKELMLEIKRYDAFDKVYIGTDYFDASIDRIAATIIGGRSVQKALLYALLEPTEMLRKVENAGDYMRRLAWNEDKNTLPFASIWEMYCERAGMPARCWTESF
jgi:L-rhamnose isomerase